MVTVVPLLSAVLAKMSHWLPTVPWTLAAVTVPLDNIVLVLVEFRAVEFEPAVPT